MFQKRKNYPIRGEESLDLSGERLTDSKAIKVLATRFGYKTRTLNLSGNKIGLRTLRFIRGELQRFVENGKMIKLNLLDLRNNDFNLSEDKEIKKCLGEIAELMATERKIEHEGNNGIIFSYSKKRKSLSFTLFKCV